MARHDDEVDQPLTNQDFVRRGSEACLAGESDASTGTGALQIHLAVDADARRQLDDQFAIVVVASGSGLVRWRLVQLVEGRVGVLRQRDIRAGPFGAESAFPGAYGRHAGFLGDKGDQGSAQAQHERQAKDEASHRVAS